MEKHKTESFEFPSFIVYCFGELQTVNMVIQYFMIHKTEKNIDINLFLSRLVSSGIEAYAKGKNLKGKIEVKRINKYFEENNTLLSSEKYSDMMFFWNPDFCTEKLGLTERQKALMMDHVKSVYYPNEDFDWREDGFFPKDSFNWRSKDFSEDVFF